MSAPFFRDFDPDRDRAALTDLLTTEVWLTHPRKPRLCESEVEALLAQGYWTCEDVITVVIEVDGIQVGVIRVDRLSDATESPRLDLRLRERVRGRGIGLEALSHITEVVFTRYPEKHRIVGDTRADNTAMRRVFARGGFTQEAVYRSAWTTPDGALRDAMLRYEWDAAVRRR